MNEHYGAILLAGGRSSRMGRDKAFLEISGKTMLERLLLSLYPIVAETVVIRAPGQKMPRLPQELQEWIRVGQDSVEGRGPLQGIVDALPLLSSAIDKVFLITCDLPSLSTNWLQTLSDIMTDEYDLVCTEENNIANPLLALYRRPVLEPASKLLAEGIRRPISLWEGWRVARLSAPLETPWICRDVNTPEEFQEAQTYLSKNEK
ncbi:MAG: putative molybdenum cofactor guanylyltransferase [Deltaproteobacteria bacterium]|jgi:molybdopterin-guanine dinucleotide biosynthesis protein A|nr:putative molybdenum cofactor guanylyltransferase [Deltaproteobacteria bacterium]